MRWPTHEPVKQSAMAGLVYKSMVVSERERHRGTQGQVETALFISSLSADAKRLPHASRAHWSVETTAH